MHSIHLDIYSFNWEEYFMVIKILGSGCDKCVKLMENTKEALKELGIEAELEKIEDFKDIMKYGVMTTPALVVDEKIVSVGKILKPKDIVKILNQYLLHGSKL
jgi:small redox-active disulfide protein 2